MRKKQIRDKYLSWNIVDFNYHYQPQIVTKDACMGEKKRVRQERSGHKGGGGEKRKEDEVMRKRERRRSKREDK